MNAIWAGFLHFENTRIAIELFPATTKSSSFLQHVHSECHANLQRSLTCPEHGIVNKAEQTLTYNMPDGDQIMIEPDELTAIRTEKSKRMTLRHFIPKSQLDPTDFKRSYFACPRSRDRHNYNVLREAMRHTGLYGIGNLTLKGRSRPVAVWVKQQHLILSTLFYQHEQNNLPHRQTTPSSVLPTTHEVRTCRNRMFARRVALQPHMREDHNREQLIDLLGRKIVQVVSDNQLSFTEPDAAAKRISPADIQL